MKKRQLWKRMLCFVLGAAVLPAMTACGGGGGEEESEGQNTDSGQVQLDEEEAWKTEPAYGQTLYYWVSDGCTAAPSIADELGYFEEAGLKVEGYKSTNDVEALGTGSAHIAVGHIAKQLVPASNGVDLCFVGGAHKGCKSLYVLGDSNYQSTEDLKGTSIAVPNGIGNSDYNITARLLDADGINPLTDVNLTQVETGACVAAMQNGELSAALLSDTYAYDMLKDGTLRNIRSMLDEDLDQICCAIGMNATFVKENPITAKKMAQCVKKALHYMNDNPEEATQLLLDLGLNSGDFDMNVEINKSLQFGPDDAFTESQLRQIIDDYIRIGLLTATDDGEQVMAQVWNPLAPEL